LGNKRQHDENQLVVLWVKSLVIIAYACYFWYHLYGIIEAILMFLMTALSARDNIVRQLQKEVLLMQGHKRPTGSQCLDTGLGPMEVAFPDRTFPTGAVHEFISHEIENAACTNGFISGLLGRLMKQGGPVLWISTKRCVYPPALKIFGIEPERVIFIDLAKAKDALWAIEEALKCEALAAVVGEVSELSFTESRRLQLAVEQSRVTGFVHRYRPRSENNVACVTRWKIGSLASKTEDGLPGVGFPRWNVQLLKVRNGKPGSWEIEWSEGRFQHAEKERLSIPKVIELPIRKAG
jgi:protein ImuA